MSHALHRHGLNRGGLARHRPRPVTQVRSREQARACDVVLAAVGAAALAGLALAGAVHVFASLLTP